MRSNPEKFKKKLATEYETIPEDERQKIQQLKRTAPWDGRLFWRNDTPEEKLLKSRENSFRFNTLKSIREYLTRPRSERIKFLDETQLALEKAIQHRKKQEARFFRKDEYNYNGSSEEIEQRSIEQIQTLTDMYTEAAKAEILYGFNSEQCQKTNQRINDYSKRLTHQARMALLSVPINATLRAVSELRSNPTTAAIVAERINSEKFNHDNERIVECEYTQKGYYNQFLVRAKYKAVISRAFPREGKTMNVSATFTCEIDILKWTATLTYHNTFSDKPVAMSDLARMQETIKELPLSRDYIKTYLNENLLLVFGEGAGQKSINNFFNWYDRVIAQH